MSSTIARVSRNDRKETGARDAASVRTPSANAMSVATGTPQPPAVSLPALSRRYTPAGTTMPPMAAMMGRARVFGSRSSPVVTSRLISRPTTRKNRVIRPSLTQCCKSMPMLSPPSWTVAKVLHRCSYEPRSGELGQTSATTVAPRRKTPDASSVRRNSSRRVERSSEERTAIASLFCRPGFPAHL